MYMGPKLAASHESGFSTTPSQERTKASLQAKISSLGRVLNELQRELNFAEADSRPLTPNNEKSEAHLGQLASRLYKERRRRAAIFGGDDLFGEPAWDILLDLFVAKTKSKKVAVTSACIGASVPSTTAYRWLKILEVEGLVTRELDQADQRRSFVALSRAGEERMTRYLQTYV